MVVYWRRNVGNKTNARAERSRPLVARSLSSNLPSVQAMASRVDDHPRGGRTMKHLFSQLTLITALAVLGGCYYDPGYNYVRTSTYGGDAYYGTAVSPTYVVPPYYGGYAGYGGYPGYGGYGCCYGSGVSIGISSGYYPYRAPYYGYSGGAYYRGAGYREHQHYRVDHYDNRGGHHGNYGQNGHGRPSGHTWTGSAGRPSSSHQQRPHQSRPSSYQRPPSNRQPSPHVHASEANPRSRSYPGHGRKAAPQIREDG